MFGLTLPLTDEEIREKARQLCSRMTTKEKAFLLSGNWNMIRDSIKYKRTYNPVPINSHGCKRLKIDPIRFTDGPRGVVMGQSTCFPVSIARAASFDRDLERQIGEAIGAEAKESGANLFAGVCINLMMHPAGGRSQESYGEDPYLVGEMGSQLVKGVQRKGIMACVKHYACNNQENMRFHVDVDCDERTLREVYLSHFKKCMDAGAASVMGSYNRFRGDQASESEYLLTKVLRDEWGFQGFALTDFIFALRDSAKAIRAGMDMEMPIPVHYGMELLKHVEEGRVSTDVLDRAVLRVLCAQIAFASIEHTENTQGKIACEAHIALSRRAAEESMVLLKNQDHTLPFDKSVKRILLVGHLAKAENTGDHGSSNVYPPYVITIMQGLENYLGDEGGVLYCPEEDLAQAQRLAQSVDAVLIIAGNDYADEGEYVVPDSRINATECMANGLKNNNNRLMGWMMSKAAQKQDGNISYTSDDGKPVGGDRASLSLRATEIEAIRTLAPICPNTVVVLVSGSMILTREWDDAAPAILCSWYSGMEGGNALASILFGEVSPSGKLPFAIPEDAGHLHPFDIRAESAWYDYHHGYRLLDKNGNAPAYPFGFGLSYTDFAYSGWEASYVPDKNCVQVSFNLKNTGNTTGAEVSQVYVSVPGSSVERHKKELKGFCKTSLVPGESRNITICISLDELRYFDPSSGAWILEPGEYVFSVGTDSADAMGHQAICRI